MKFYSTKNKGIRVSLQEAVTQGLAKDGGLYLPESIRPLPESFFKELPALSNQEIGYRIAQHLMGEDLPDDVIRSMTSATIGFDVPLVQLEDRIWALELFHGPTLAFKDFGARFMAAVLGYYAQQQQAEYTILVATSGDTGSAVAHGFYNVPGIKVVVLYPSGKVSDLQEKQFTTLGNNITALEVAGTFDDCQRLVKQAFQDDTLNKKLKLSSANSINIARLIPQSFYYFFAMAQMPKGEQVTFSVPSGNFGNLTGGVLAMKMGLPIHHFIAATNSNDVVPEYLTTGKFLARPSIQTISNAMDVGDPSNFDRLLNLFDQDHDKMSKAITGYSFSDWETKSIMKDLYHAKGYALDPHGAVGYLGLKRYLSTNENTLGIFLETAHPGKFAAVVESAIEEELPLPESLESLKSKSKQTIFMNATFAEFREILMR